MKTEEQRDEELYTSLNNYRDQFVASMSDDLNTADAIANIFELVKFINSKVNEDSPREFVEEAYKLFMELCKVIGILSKDDEILEEDILRLIEERARARKDKDFARSDEIRDELFEKGIVLEDTRDGVKWKKV